VDYLLVNSDGSYQQTFDPSSAHLVRITLFNVIESAALSDHYKNNQNLDPGIETKFSEIRRPDIITGDVTMILNGEAKSIDDLVQLDYLPYEYEIEPKVYSTIELDQAFEQLKAGEIGTSLVYLKKEDEDVFSKYTPVNVVKYSVDAAATRIIYIEPETWDHLDPEADWDGHLYPFYWFEGIALLDNGDQLDFVFLVDAIPQGSS
jgi:hypothetical protein